VRSLPTGGCAPALRDAGNLSLTRPMACAARAC
jgi:hypothetical protein